MVLGYRNGVVAVATLVAGSLPCAAAVSGEGVVWTRNLTDATYRTAGISIPGQSLAAGTWLNPPRQTELFALDGAGVPEWTFPGIDVEAAASRNADVVASADFDNVGLTVTVRKWHVDSGDPDWSYVIENARPSFRRIAVSPDGSTIAALVTRQGDPIAARLVYFDAGSAEPLGVFDADDGTFARNLAISEDGAFIAFMGGINVYVVDRDEGGLRYSVAAEGSNDPIAISGDGNYIAYGWLSLFVREWDGATYRFLWSRPLAPMTLKSSVISTDGSTLVTGSSNPQENDQNRIDVFDVTSSTPRWTYLYEQHPGKLQDVPWDIAVTATGSHFVVGSWGDEFNTNPEVHVFAPTDDEPLFTVDTPGSMFDVDIARAPGGIIRVAACGKHIHANDSGRGGDIYSIRLLTDCTSDLDGNGFVDFSDLLTLLAAWGPYEPCPPFRVEDVDQDCDVGFNDLLALLAAWGVCE